MKKLAIAALACVLVGGFCFSACTIERIDPEADNNTTATNTGKRVLNVCNWGEYIDEDLITQFQEETGITVNYQTAGSNESLYSLLKNGGANYDVICPSDYMISQLIE